MAEHSKGIVAQINLAVHSHEGDYIYMEEITNVLIKVKRCGILSINQSLSVCEFRNNNDN